MTEQLRRLSVLAAALLSVLGSTSGRADTPLSHGPSPLSVTDTTGMTANGSSGQPAISATGQYVAFSSIASDLVADDTNGLSDIFVRNRDANGDGKFDVPSDMRTTRASVTSTGSQGAGGQKGSLSPSISADGDVIAFQSDASNLVPNDHNAVSDVFLYRMSTQTTTRVSVSRDGSDANDESVSPTVSADGRIVFYQSYASNLVDDDRNDTEDIFAFNIATKETRLVSRSSMAGPGNDWSKGPAATNADGSLVVYYSAASNLVENDTNREPDIFLYSLATGSTGLISSSRGESANGASEFPSISGDGRFVAFDSWAQLTGDDRNDAVDVYLFDRVTGTLSLQSRNSDGVQMDGTTTLDQETSPQALSGNGRYLILMSYAKNLGWTEPANTEQVYLRDTATGLLCLVSVGSTGLPAFTGAYSAAISSASASAVFVSTSPLLSVNDGNLVSDVFAPPENAPCH